MLRYNFCTNIFAIPKPMEWLRRFRDQTSLFCKGNRRTQGTHALPLMDQTCLGRSGGLDPVNFPLFHGCCFGDEMKTVI